MKHHRFIAYLIVFLLFVLTACHVASDSRLDYQDPAILPSQTIEDTEEPSTQPDIIEETTSPSMPTNATRPEPSTRPTDPPKLYPNYYGRLHIPEVGIDVALYYGADQAITDRKDSANVFTMSVFDGLYISDHSTQEFGKLLDVEVGMRGYIVLADGTKLGITCTEILTGHNTGKYIVDENGNTDLDGDILMYTCRDSWRNILICLWKHD